MLVGWRWKPGGRVGGWYETYYGTFRTMRRWRFVAWTCKGGAKGSVRKQAAGAEALRFIWYRLPGINPRPTLEQNWLARTRDCSDLSILDPRSPKARDRGHPAPGCQEASWSLSNLIRSRLTWARS